MENSYFSNTKSCQVDIPEFETLDYQIPSKQSYFSSKKNYDYIPDIKKKIRKLSPETEKSKVISQRRMMASVGKRGSKDKIYKSTIKSKQSIPFFDYSKPQSDFCEFLDNQVFVKRIHKNEELPPEAKLTLPKIVEKKESAPVYKKGKLGPLVHSPYREVQAEDPYRATIRKYSYFHIRNFSIHTNAFEP